MIEITTVDRDVSAKFRGGKVTVPLRAGSHSFGAGIYVLVGKKDSGNVGLSYVLSGKCGLAGCTVKLDGKKLSAKELADTGCFIGNWLSCSGSTPVRRLIERGLRKNRNTGLTSSIIAEKFMLTPGRLTRRMSYQGNEGYRAAIAVGYAAGKRIYCTQYITADRWMNYLDIVLKPYLEMLREEGMTVIIPADSAEYFHGIAEETETVKSEK